jgi:hypothetical protein
MVLGGGGLGPRDGGFGAGQVQARGRVLVGRAEAADQPAEARALGDDGDEDDREGADQHEVAARHISIATLEKEPSGYPLKES